MERSCSNGSNAILAAARQTRENDAKRAVHGRCLRAARSMAPSGLTVCAAIVKNLVDAVDALGADGGALARRLEIDPATLTDASARVDDAFVRELLRLAPSCTKDPAFGLHAGERSARGVYGLAEYFIVSSATLRDGLVLLADNYALLSEVGHVSFSEDDQFGYVSFTNSRRAVYVQEAEYFAAAVVTVARRATGVSDILSFVELPHSPPADTSEHARVFQAPVRFDMPHTRLAFDRAAQSRSLRSADAALASVLRPAVTAARATVAPTEDIVERVRATVRRKVGEGDAAMESIARALGRSRRSLQRALAERGTTYQAVLDDARKELALRYVAEPGRTLSEIAFDLAFARATAFHRAFRRWTGKTPMTYRAEILARTARPADQN